MQIICTRLLCSSRHSLFFRIIIFGSSIYTRTITNAVVVSPVLFYTVFLFHLSTFISSLMFNSIYLELIVISN